ncbi:UDP-glucose 4-epimerase [Candidatus Burkholderia verschuerenii]|uniref:UDP-glucose 4-epimerase n=1 Tax=Candidatus Burkholderia verschuerenii TaxID=242163 RepID=A0A0L0MDV5_9BURK|nr:SDR family oxidoreductase [Candidatus Burkholderia verschuerenii]KND60134.1 UDP-glucose 4-epimerase [Candidatus Burkholderia verschuerenii]
MSEQIAVTGANGFVGRAALRALRDASMQAVAVVRTSASADPRAEVVRVRSLDDITPATFAGCESVIHLAARVHVMNDAARDPLAEFRATNADATLKTAEAAREAGATRFVFVSSIKALGDADSGRPLKETDARNPPDPYGISKAEAEVMLQAFGARTGMEIVIARPPLVYGPEVRANFLSLMRAIARGMPLPIGAIDARRSMVYVDNLASALVECATHPRAANQLFHITDGEDPGVAELARRLGHHLQRPARLLPVPVGVLKTLGSLTGKSAQIERLTGSLQVDSSHIRDVLGWRPSFSLDSGLAATAAWYLNATKS